MPWYATLGTLAPHGWTYCDGNNGTPDLRGRTIIGAGSWNGADGYGNVLYNTGDSGGERMHQLTIAEMPAHNHLQNDMNDLPTSVDSYNVYNTWHSDGDGPKYHIHSYTGYAGGNQPHNILPPYTALIWIMKL